MKRIAIGLTSALLVLTNSGFAQSVNTLAGQYAQSQKFLQDQGVRSSGLISEQLQAIQKQHAQIDNEAIARGGFDSGGGTLVLTNQGTGLLDLYLNNRDAFLSTKKGEALPETRTYKSFGFDRLHDSKIAIVQKALYQIEKWNLSSPIMAPYITRAVKALPIYYTKYQIGVKDFMSYIPEGVQIPAQNLNLAALYAVNVGVFVEKKSFDGLSETNQIALIIHEALRHEQITYSSGISNEKLQKLTADILRDPTPGKSLDRFEYMEGRVLDEVLRRKAIMAEAYEIADELCRAFPKNCSLKMVAEPSTYKLGRMFRKISNELWTHENNKEAILFYKMNILASSLNGMSVTEAVENSGIREAMFTLQNVSGFGTLDVVTKTYNENGGYFSDEAKAMRAFIKVMKDTGLFF